MKRANILLCIGLAGILSGCEGGDQSPDPGKTPPVAVPITLQAGSQTKAVVNPGKAFAPLLLCSNTSQEYQRLRWQNNATVAADGSVAYDGYGAGEGPTYPYEAGFPFDIYISGVHPQGADLTTKRNFATYPITGADDIMYAPEVFGNYQDGQRICGNTEQSKDKPLAFRHLLTQLQFKAFRTGSAAAGQFTISRITLKAVPSTLTINLKDGTATVGDATKELDAPLNIKDNESKVIITSVDEAQPDAVGYALVPAATSYEATLQTSLGEFDIVITTATGLVAGNAHTITLKLIDYGVAVSTVTAAYWEDIDSGDIDL